jgi:hypothetical protein
MWVGAKEVALAAQGALVQCQLQYEQQLVTAEL